MEPLGNRVVIIDEISNTTIIKTDAQIVEENEQIKKLLEPRRPQMTDRTDQIKDAIREDDFQKFMEKKKTEKVAQAEAIKETVVETTAPLKTLVEERRVSLKLGVIGSGQGGSKVAKVFYDFGYSTCVINTAKQDLELLDIPEDNKFYLNYSIGGAGRDLEVGKAAIEEDYDAVKDFVEEKLADADVSVLAVAGGGGSGAGSATTLVRMLTELGKPIIVIYILPGSADDSQSKHNAIKTLAELSDLAAKEIINSLVLVDNAKIELAYPSLSQAAFWQTANNAIVQPLHIFNKLTATPSEFESLDSMDLAKALLGSGNCVLFGSNSVEKEKYDGDETALVEAIVDNLEHGLLASGFDLKEAQTVGILITASPEVLASVPYNSISYIFKYISSEFNSAKTFKGVYSVSSNNENINIHFVFSGMGLPKDRIEYLKNEAKRHMENLEVKKKTSNDRMAIDIGKDRTTAANDEIMDRIKKKKGAVNKLINSSRKGVIDRRR